MVASTRMPPGRTTARPAALARVELGLTPTGHDDQIGLDGLPLFVTTRSALPSPSMRVTCSARRKTDVLFLHVMAGDAGQGRVGHPGQHLVARLR